MGRYKGSVLIPLLVIMVICAGCAVFATHLISVNSKQSLGLRKHLESRLDSVNHLNNVSRLLKQSGHDANELPLDVASYITGQEKFTVDQADILVTSVSVFHPANKYVKTAASYILYPWIKQLPSAAVVSARTLPAAANIMSNSLPVTPSILSAYSNDMKTWFLSAPDAVTTLPEPIADCAMLDKYSQGAFVVETTCTISKGQVVGSPAHPVLLIVRQSNFSMQDNSQFWGILYQSAVTKNDLSRISVPDTSAIYGAILIDHKLSPVSHVNVIYHPDILTKLRAHPSLQLHHRVPGSWRDFE
ncbi:hypothetical protein [Salinimonas iocasae]|uniref:Uncharacterized protein n=1 Tax=Salinimonas iocasae TaxID=2572577 RepID=A0A5B7YBQ5_9ALTE|nr:hypothetical protein [Salinimonas iocasae]QCZ93014.1 hypothetical protein FBQ74_05710 [Salinimonas iocasae]